MAENMVLFTLQIPPDLKQKLAERAYASSTPLQRVSMAEIVREILRTALQPESYR